MRKLQTNIQNTHQIRPITRSDIAGPAFLALIPLGVIVTLITNQVGGPGYPIIFAVLLVAFVTFLERAIWLRKRRKSHDLILNPRAFAPERIGFLGLTIVIAIRNTTNRGFHRRFLCEVGWRSPYNDPALGDGCWQLGPASSA